VIVIGLMGPAGAGKSSVADYLVENYGAKRYSFATPLKDMVSSALEFSHEQMWGTQAQKEAPDERYGGKSARWFLQRIGTEGCRKTFGENFWVERGLAQVLRDRPHVAVFDDARFITEANGIRAIGTCRSKPSEPRFRQLVDVGYVWRLDSPDRRTNADALHQSEREWLDAPCDYEIKPLERGLPLLFQLVDEACRHHGLFKRGAVSL
jgi:hypothetical protein